MTLQLELTSELERQLQQEAERAGVGESEYALTAIADRLAHCSAKLSEAEDALLREIDRGFSDAWWDRYAALVRKREDETISEDEHRELCVLSDAVEEYNVRRMSCIAGVAKRHGVSLQELMEQLDMRPRTLD